MAQMSSLRVAAGAQVEHVAIVKSKTFYQPELDVLRFVAFAMVFVRHSTPFPVRFMRAINEAASFGLPIFFMLSAYLIGGLLLRERERVGTVHVGAFYVRRILRIWPLYFLALGLGYAFGHLIPVYHVPLEALPYYLLLCANVYTAHHTWEITGTISVLWSLSVEEQFYLVIPGLARLGGRTALRWIAFVSLAAAYVALVVLAGRHEAEVPVWSNSFVQFQFFAAGILLAIYLRSREWNVSLLGRAGFLLGGAVGFVIAGRVLMLEPMLPHGAALLCGGYFVGLLSCTAVFLAFHRVPLRVPRPLLYLGQISYGLYVFHPFAIALIVYAPYWYLRRPFSSLQLIVAIVAAFVVTVVLAAASYELFEKRILRLKERFAYVKSGALEMSQAVR